MNSKLGQLDSQIRLASYNLTSIFSSFSDLDVPDKRQIISLIPPAKIDLMTGDLSLLLNDALRKILSCRKKAMYVGCEELPGSSDEVPDACSTTKKVLPINVVSILAKHKIQVSEQETKFILNLLYKVAETAAFKADNVAIL